MRTIKKILVPTDLSELSVAAVDYAATLASTHGARIYMLYVAEGESRHETLPAEPCTSPSTGTCDEEGRKELHRFVYWKLREIGDVVEVVRVGKAETEIRRFAEEEGIDLIVMATHGRTGLAHVLMGSVAEKVVRLSSVPVMTVKPESCLGALITEKDVEEDLHLNV
jgi:nucleotide-binding universal stress UspA family protein